MTNINVVFELSEEIAKGLADGTLERVGGVIRRVGNKKIVVWLTEAGAEASEKSGLPSILSSPQMLMGLQVANLAVNVAGFALIYRKLQQVQRQIEGVDQKLQALSEAHAWLEKKHLIEHLAPMCSALEALSSIHYIQDQETSKSKLLDADSKLENASIYFRNVLREMLVNKLEQERPEEFAVCYRAWVMASQGRIQTMAELGEIPLAQHLAQELKAQHQVFGRDFLKVRRDPLRKLTSERVHADSEAILKEIGQQSAGAHEIIKGRVLQLDYMVENRLTLNDFPAISDGSRGAYAYIYL